VALWAEVYFEPRRRVVIEVAVERETGFAADRAAAPG
jgi:hypothetical protein